MIDTAMFDSVFKFTLYVHSSTCSKLASYIAVCKLKYER